MDKSKTTKCAWCKGAGTDVIQHPSLMVVMACVACRGTGKQRGHWSDCATHNIPALPAGPCDCGVFYE